MTISIIFILYFAITVWLFILSYSIAKKLHEIAITPKRIYNITNLNMFGCVVVFVLSLILNPITYILYFIYFIFHVGRKE